MKERVYRVGVKVNKLFHAFRSELGKFSDYVENYISDGWYFFSCGDYVSALAAFDYAYGLIEGFLRAIGKEIPSDLK